MRHYATVTYKDHVYRLCVNILVNEKAIEFVQYGNSYESAVMKLSGLLSHFNYLGEVTTRFKNKSELTEKDFLTELKDSGVPNKSFCGCKFIREDHSWKIVGTRLSQQDVNQLQEMLKDEISLSSDGLISITVKTQRALLEVVEVLKNSI